MSRFVFVVILVTLAAFAAAVCSIHSAKAGTLGAIGGTVYNESGSPIARALVTAKSAEGTVEKTSTGIDGRYLFPRLAFDTYVVTVNASGLAPQTAVVTVASGSVATLDFHLSKKTLGTVVTRATAGTPASVNVISQQTIAALPGNFKLAHVTETTPGIVPFSYDEPVSRGFHGVSYEIDGVPIQQTASSEFSEIIDPRDVDRLEVFTGAFPAEFGGQRQGAVVDIISRRPTATQGGFFSVYGGNYGNAGTQLSDAFGGGPFKAFVSLNLQRNSRGIDSPTFVPVHDNSSQSDEFLRLTYTPNSRDSIALHFSNQFAGFQVPIDPNPGSISFAPPGTDDNQYEYDRFANIVFNRLSADGQGYFEIAPFYQRARVTYTNDPPNDLAAAAASSTFQDRIGTYYGLTSAWFRGGPKHNVKVGFSVYTEDFTSAFNIQFFNSSMMLQQFTDNVSQTGWNYGVYAEDRVTVSPVVNANLGLRYDRSTGFTSGNQLEPRAELNILADDRNTVHFYYGRLYAAPALEDVRRDATVVTGGAGLPVYDLKPETDSIYEMGVSHQVSPLIKWSANYWARAVANVLDTTQLASTPLFTVFNSTSGRAQGLEFNVTGQTESGDSYFLSYGLSESQASGISGGTFLFSPAALQGANGFAFEDHDQTNTLNTAYTWRLAHDNAQFVTLGTRYGSGFPVQFINGPARLPAHWEIDAAYGRRATAGHLGYELQATNLLDHKYLIKFNNGFNTTQYAPGLHYTATITVPLQ